MFPHPITAKCARNRSVGRSVIIDERGTREGNILPPLLRKRDATCCLLLRLRRRVRVPFGSPSLLARPVRHPHLANRPILLPLGLLPMRHFTTLAIHSRRSADNSCIRSRPLTDGSLPPSFLPSSLVSHYSIRLSRRRSLPKMTNSRRRRRRRRRSDGRKTYAGTVNTGRGLRT